jgi:hypothetical protein
MQHDITIDAPSSSVDVSGCNDSRGRINTTGTCDNVTLYVHCLSWSDLLNVQMVSGTQPIPYPLDNKDSQRSKGTTAWSWRLTSICCRSRECVELHLHSILYRSRCLFKAKKMVTGFILINVVTVDPAFVVKSTVNMLTTSYICQVSHPPHSFLCSLCCYQV